MRFLLYSLFIALLTLGTQYPVQAQSKGPVPPPKIRHVSGFRESALNGTECSFTDLINAMRDPDDEPLRFRRLTVTYDESKDGRHVEGMDRWDSTGTHKLLFTNHHLEISDSDFDDEFWFVLNGADFRGNISFLNCRNLKLRLRNCTFRRSVRFLSANLDFVEFDHCTFQGGVRLERCSVGKYVAFKKCDINADSVRNGRGLDMAPELFSVIYNQGGDLIIENSTVMPQRAPRQVWWATLYAPPKPFPSRLHWRLLPRPLELDFTSSRFKNLRLDHDAIHTSVVLDRTLVENQFYFYDSRLNGKLIMIGAGMNPTTSFINWDEINRHHIAIRFNDALVDGSQITLLYQHNLLERLISNYSVFYQTFKSQGNRQEANECYKEWKTIELEYEKLVRDKSAVENSQETGVPAQIQADFYYWMNVFLKWFSDYGTNPSKALFQSLLVIMVFGLIYFFCPMEIIGTPHRSVYSQMSLYRQFIEQDEGNFTLFRRHLLEHSSRDPHRRLRQRVRRSGQKLPWFFHLWAKGPLLTARYFTHVEGSVYRAIDQWPHAISTMPPRQRMGAGVVFYAILLFGLGTFIVLRLAECLILSINVFSTLGFGELRVKGPAVYLTILEGFIGWFLLGIFSVTLLGQILN